MESFFSYVSVLGPLILGFLIFAWANRRSVIELKEIETLATARASYEDSNHAVVLKFDERIALLMEKRLSPKRPVTPLRVFIESISTLAAIFIGVITLTALDPHRDNVIIFAIQIIIATFLVVVSLNTLNKLPALFSILYKEIRSRSSQQKG